MRAPRTHTVIDLHTDEQVPFLTSGGAERYARRLGHDFWVIRST